MLNTTVSSLSLQIAMLGIADDRALPTDSHKFPTFFRTRLDEISQKLEAHTEAVPLTEAERKLAQEQLDTALTEARSWIRSVQGRIQGLPPTIDKIAVFTAYGLAGGKLGVLSQARVATLLALFPDASAAQPHPDAKLPADFLTNLARLRQSIEASRVPASIGVRGEKVRTKQATVKEASDIVSRAFAYLTFALPLRDRDPLLHDYGFTPRQLPQKR